MWLHFIVGAKKSIIYFLILFVRRIEQYACRLRMRNWPNKILAKHVSRFYANKFPCLFATIILEEAVQRTSGHPYLQSSSRDKQVWLWRQDHFFESHFGRMDWHWWHTCFLQRSWCWHLGCRCCLIPQHCEKFLTISCCAARKVSRPVKPSLNHHWSDGRSGSCSSKRGRA